MEPSPAPAPALQAQDRQGAAAVEVPSLAPSSVARGQETSVSRDSGGHLRASWGGKTSWAQEGVGAWFSASGGLAIEALEPPILRRQSKAAARRPQRPRPRHPQTERRPQTPLFVRERLPPHAAFLDPQKLNRPPHTRPGSRGAGRVLFPGRSGRGAGGLSVILAPRCPSQPSREGSRSCTQIPARALAQLFIEQQGRRGRHGLGAGETPRATLAGTAAGLAASPADGGAGCQVPGAGPASGFALSP